MNSNYYPDKAAAAQEQYCSERNTPMYAPKDGVCPCCGRNIYSSLRTSKGEIVVGYSVQFASEHLITRCSWCCASFTD